MRVALDITVDTDAWALDPDVGLTAVDRTDLVEALVDYARSVIRETVDAGTDVVGRAPEWTVRLRERFAA